MSYKRICHTCGNTYEYCPNCGAFASKPRWMCNWDTEECKEVFNALSGYNMGIKKVDEVKAVLEQYNVTDFSKYTEDVASQLEKIVKPSFKKKVKDSVEE